MQSEAALRQQIELINHKNLQELRDQFRELHGFEGGDTTPRNLRKRIIYRLQEIYYGGVEPIDMEILDSIADKDPLANLKIVATKRATKVRGRNCTVSGKASSTRLRSARTANISSTARCTNRCRR